MDSNSGSSAACLLRRDRVEEKGLLAKCRQVVDVEDCLLALAWANREVDAEADRVAGAAARLRHCKKADVEFIVSAEPVRCRMAAIRGRMVEILFGLNFWRPTPELRATRLWHHQIEGRNELSVALSTAVLDNLFYQRD
jgi:hypothetical protein